MGEGPSRAASAAALLLAGCTLLHAHGTPVPEVGRAACDDGLDQDLDGLVDCRDEDCALECHEATDAACSDGYDQNHNDLLDCVDPTCVGHCPEQSIVACTNGQDDDGDGRLDVLDPECWASSEIEVERCASVLGGFLDVSPYTSWTGDYGVEPEPGGSQSLSIGGRITFSGLPYVLPGAWSNDTVAGSFEGLEADWSMRPGHNGMSVGIGERDPFGGLAYGIVLLVRPGATVTNDTALNLLPYFQGNATAVSEIVPVPYVSEWLHVHLTVEAGTIHLIVTRDDGSPYGEPMSAPLPPIPEGSVLRAIAESQYSSGERGRLGSLSVRRRDVTRCEGVRAPPFGVSTEPTGPRHAATTLTDLVRGEDGLVCAVGVTQTDLGTYGPGEVRTVYAYRSLDDGVTWTRAAALASLPLDFGTSAYPVVGRDRIDGRFHVVLLTMSRGRIASLHTESSDCMAFSPMTDTGIQPPDAMHQLGIPTSYAVDDGGHALRMVLVDPATWTQAVRTARSPWGFDGTWTWDETDDASLFVAFPPPGGRPVEGAVLASRTAHVGADEVAVVNAWDGTLQMAVHGSRTQWTHVPGLRLAASHEVGAFDAAALGLGMLLEDAPTATDPPSWTGRLFYSGRYDAINEGWGWARLRIHARGTP